MFYKVCKAYSGLSLEELCRQISLRFCAIGGVSDGEVISGVLHGEPYDVPDVEERGCFRCLICLTILSTSI